MIDRIERETQSNPAFKNLHAASGLAVPKRWARVEKARGYSELPPKKVLGLIDCSPRNPAIRDQAAALASIENELSMAMLANGY
jgi:hypothetical protein